MTDGALRHRLARAHDVAALTAVMEAAIARLQRPFLEPEQIAASRALMGLDRQLIEDRTYFVVEQAGALAGLPLYAACGYRASERFVDARGGVAVPLVRMAKAL